MNTDSGAIYLGSALTIVAFKSFALNCFVLRALWKNNFLKSKHDGIYILAFANMFGNAFSMFIFTVYLGPVCITQTLLFSSLRPFPQFIGFMFHAQWFQDVILTAFTALNRWIVVVGPSYIPKITRTHTFAFIIFAYCSGVLISISSSYIFHCCTMFLDYKTMTFAYAGDGPNYADNYLDLPINITCFTVAILCYMRIYWFVKSTNVKIMSTLSKSKAEERKSKEMKYAIQFAACTGCAIAICVLFHVLPFFLPPGIDRAYITYSFLEILHSSANALIFVIFNNEIRKKVLTSFLPQSQSSHLSNIQKGPKTVVIT